MAVSVDGIGTSLQTWRLLKKMRQYNKILLNPILWIEVLMKKSEKCCWIGTKLMQRFDVIGILTPQNLLTFHPSVASSLSQVVQKMAQVNQSMNGISSSSKEVQEVADLWRESFSSQKSDSESSLSLAQSRDLNYCVP